MISEVGCVALEAEAINLRNVRIQLAERFPEYSAYRGLTPRTLTPAHTQALERWEKEHLCWYYVAMTAGIPRRHWPASFEAGLQTRALLEVQHIMKMDLDEDDEDEDESPSPGCVVLCGPSGVGKTWAVAAGARSIRRAEPFVWWTMPALVRALLDPARRQDVMAEALKAELLVIDDVGASYIKPDGLGDALFSEIFLEREANDVDGIVLCTTNLTARQLYAELGDRVADRLRGEWGHVVELPGESLRGKGKGRRG